MRQRKIERETERDRDRERAKESELLHYLRAQALFLELSLSSSFLCLHYIKQNGRQREREIEGQQEVMKLKADEHMGRSWLFFFLILKKDRLWKWVPRRNCRQVNTISST